MGEGFGLAVELVDGVNPLRQPVSLGIECARAVDVPQQVCPAALFGAVVVVVGSVEVANQHAKNWSPRTSSTTALLRFRLRKYRWVGVLKVHT